MSAPASAGGRDMVLKFGRVCGAAVGYGSLVAFLFLISLQLYRWFRDGEWTRFGVSEGLRAGLTRCCGGEGDAGRVAAFMHWLDAPVDWLGLHLLLEVVPASLALFAVSILGNSLFIYCGDRLEFARRHAAAEPVDAAEQPDPDL